MTNHEFCSAVRRFDSEDEAVAIANACDVGLAGERVFPRTPCGGRC